MTVIGMRDLKGSRMGRVFSTELNSRGRFEGERGL